MSKIEIRTNMFRVRYEYIALLISVAILITIGIVLSTINVYLFLLLLVLGIVYVQLNQAQFLGNAIRIYQNQFPEIYEIFRIHAVNLQINKASLYIVQNPIPNAYTIGITSCSVILTSGLVEQFSLKELNFTLAHELGHYKAGHTKISTLINPLGSTNIFSNIIFGFWQRKTEYSADRCGLILSKDLDSGITALLKLSIGGKLFEDFNLNGYLAQIKKADTTSVKLSELLIDHPLTTNRIRKLIYFWKESFTIKE
jgi:Zn-dependent protease with chaperone function